jgi:hypothetical protein
LKPTKHDLLVKKNQYFVNTRLIREDEREIKQIVFRLQSFFASGCVGLGLDDFCQRTYQLACPFARLLRCDDGYKLAMRRSLRLESEQGF